MKAAFRHAGSDHSFKNVGKPFRGVQAGVIGDRTIFMHRNPIDTAVSVFFEFHRRKLRPGTRGVHAATPNPRAHGATTAGRHRCLRVKSEVWRGARLLFHRSWLDFLGGRPNTLILTYEAARSDPADEIARLLHFAGAPNADVADIVRKTDFGAMKALQDSRDADGLHLGRSVDGDPESQRVRRGVVRGYADYLSPATIEACRAAAVRYGSDA